jgi:NADP-dependent 3-hydroxy acid dehydrogenase YdfG
MITSSPVALVIGMGPGLSAALAERFAAGGFTVVGFARNSERSQALADSLAARGQRLELRKVDAGDIEALSDAIASVEQDVGPVEVLIHNAYRATFARPSAVPVHDLVADFRVNVAAALAAVQAVLPGMRERGHGTVLLTGGGLALDPTGWLEAASLAVGKAGVRNLAFSLNRDLAAEGIRVSTVTIAGQIAAGTPFDPAAIAGRYWEVYAADGAAPAEIIFRGATP